MTPEKEPDLRGIDAILAATDLHAKSEGALRHAAYLGDLLGARIVVVHVVSSRDLGELDDPTHHGGRVGDTAMKSATNEVRNQIVTVLPNHTPEIDVRFGDPASEVVAAAKQHGCDLIVIAVATRSRLGKLLLGSHSQQVLLDSPIPVVGVKPSWTPPE